MRLYPECVRAYTFLPGQLVTGRTWLENLTSANHVSKSISRIMLLNFTEYNPTTVLSEPEYGV